MKIITTIAFAALLCFPASAQTFQNSTSPVEIPTANIHEVNTMLAFGVIDVVLTSAGMTTFYIMNGMRLCAFGKSQAIPLANGIGLVIASAGARATMNPVWIRVAGAFSSMQGTINMFRAYLGIWYHWIGSQALPLMPEQHAQFQLIESSDAPGFSIRQFLSLRHHQQVALQIFQDIILQDGNPKGTAFIGSILIGIPSIVFISGIVQFSVGLAAAI